MGLTKSEVSAAVDLRKCDSLFAVYNMLLQEELTQAKCANKPVAPLTIQAHDALILNPENRINLRENTRNEEERRIHSGAISQKHRLRFSLGRRHGVFPRKQRCERALDECISISGKQVNGCLLKQSLTNGIRIRNKYGVHDADIETIEERQVDDLKNTSKGELVDQDKGITMGIIENVSTKLNLVLSIYSLFPAKFDNIFFYIKNENILLLLLIIIIIIWNKNMFHRGKLTCALQ